MIGDNPVRSDERTLQHLLNRQVLKRIYYIQRCIGEKVEGGTVMDNRYNAIRDYFSGMKRVAVAYSGGVGSSLILKAAADALDGNRLFAITADTGNIPMQEIENAGKYCRDIGVEHVIIRTGVMNQAELSDNPMERCYVSTKYLYNKFLSIAKEHGYPVLAEGSNTDDYTAYKVGLKALKELNVLSPLKELELSKEDRDEISEEVGIKTFDKPSYSRLFDRFAYGEEISEPKLRRVDKAEQILVSMGFRQLCVHSHEDIARIELTVGDMEYFMRENIRKEVYEKFMNLGYEYVTLDIMGLNSGESINGGSGNA